MKQLELIILRQGDNSEECPDPRYVDSFLYDYNVPIKMLLLLDHEIIIIAITFMSFNA
jgi:hypothetical protein